MTELQQVVAALVVLASTAHHVDPQRALGVGRCESGLNQFAPGGGLYQLKPYGELPEFYRRGYTNVWDPAQQANFFAERFHEDLYLVPWKQTRWCYGLG